MDTLITGEKKPRSGLYTLQFSYMPMLDDPSPCNGGSVCGPKGSITLPHGGGGSTEDVIDMSPPADTDDLVNEGVDSVGNAVSNPITSVAVGDEALVDDDPSVREARLQAINKACATEFGPWTLLCRLRFEGDVMGRIKGSVKVKSRQHLSPPVATSVTAARSVGIATAGVDASEPTSSPPAQPSSSGVATTSNVSGGTGSAKALATSSGTRACIQPDSLWKPSDEVRLVISLDRLDGAVVGMKSDLTNVHIHCHSHVRDGWYVGNAAITLSTGQTLKLPRKLQFLLREYNGPRCSRCLDPIDVLPSIGCDSCNCMQYCSEQCREAHSSGHAPLCAALKPFGGSQGGRAPANFAGAEFFVYWRCVKGCTFELIADHNNPLGVPYEIQLNPLKDAREGLDYAFLLPPLVPASSSSGVENTAVATSSSSSGKVPQPAVTPEELNELNISIFFAVSQSSRDEGALLLTSACLNHLFAYCECVDNLVLSYFQFYDVCVRDQFEGVRQISCLSEYVMYVRTTFELGQTLLEWALKAPFASLFWQRLVAAKDVLVSLYNFNASLQFTAIIQNVKPILVPDQQRQTLHLLAKIFVVMASRAPKDLAQRLLRRAEECYKDSIDEDKPRKNFREMGATCLKLAALATLFDSSDDKQKSKLFKDEGMELLKLAAKAADTAQRAKEVAAARADAAAAAIAAGGAPPSGPIIPNSVGAQFTPCTV